MAANMQHMMMPPGQQQGQQQPQPQMRANNLSMQQRIYNHIISQPVNPGTWQASYPHQDRFNRTNSLYA
jgi:hypothetical protein